VNAALALQARSFGALLFDLDGTLIDTAADIAHALNLALADLQLGSVPEEAVRRMIGRGVPTLIQRALARLAAQDAAVDVVRLRERYDVHYEALYGSGAVRARLYPGVNRALEILKSRGWPLAVVTNKPTAAAVQLLEYVGLSEWLDLVIGGDQGLAPKPHPQMLLEACARFGVAPAATLMVGDSQNDVRAARAAGVAVVCVPYGYNEGADPRALPCDGFLEDLSELPALVGTPLPRSG
jgi:phosphoglycolate phosphatase